MPVKDWPDEVAAAISSIKVTETVSDENIILRTKEIKLRDKGAAQERLCKHLDIYECHNEQKTNPVAELIKSLHNKPVTQLANPIP